MKNLLRFLATILPVVPAAFAGSATLYYDSAGSPNAQGSGTVSFNSYHATSITITVGAGAYGGSQQGGGRNYRGQAAATIGGARQVQAIDPGTDPMSIGATNSVTVTRGSDGNWYDGGTNLGGGVSVSSAASVDGENVVGYADAYCFVSWVEAPPNRPPSAAISGSTVLQVGQTGTWSFGAADPDGNLAQWRFYAATNPNPQWSPVSGGAAGPGSYSTSFAAPGTYTWIVEAQDTAGATGSAGLTVTVAAPANRAPAVGWNAPPGSVADGQTYAISAHGHDPDGNLAQVNVWKNGVPFAFAGGGNGQDGDAGNATADAGPATVTFTAQAVDASGAASGVIAQVVTINAPPPPTRYTLSTSAGAGGGVSPGGTYAAGTVVTVGAAPDGMHDFAGWSGDAAGGANPVGVRLDRNRSVQANFSLKTFTLATSATAGGSVTPGGSYPAGSTVTVSASPDATHRFTGWTGDAGGAAGSVAIYLDRAKSVQAAFAGKAAQTIAFATPGNQPVGAGVVALNATASSGLPVAFAVLGGPATVTGGGVLLNGAGAVTIQASQPGDGFYLPASPVTQTFNAVAAVTLKYRGSGGTRFGTATTPDGAPLVIQVP